MRFALYHTNSLFSLLHLLFGWVVCACYPKLKFTYSHLSYALLLLPLKLIDYVTYLVVLARSALCACYIVSLIFANLSILYYLFFELSTIQVSNLGWYEIFLFHFWYLYYRPSFDFPTAQIYPCIVYPSQSSSIFLSTLATPTFALFFAVRAPVRETIPSLLVSVPTQADFHVSIATSYCYCFQTTDGIVCAPMLCQTVSLIDHVGIPSNIRPWCVVRGCRRSPAAACSSWRFRSCSLGGWIQSVHGRYSFDGWV